MRAACLLIAALALHAAPKGDQAHVRVPVWSPDHGLDGVRAQIGGADSQVVQVRGPQDDLIVLLVMDVVSDLASIEPAKEALVAQIKGLEPNRWVGVLQAQDGPRVIVDPTPDHGRIEQAIRELPTTGTAGLLENVELMGRIADSMLTKSDARVAVFYVTDSTVHNYREDFTNPVINSSDSGDLSRAFPERLIQEKIAKIERNLAQQQTPLFIVHLEYRNDRMNEAYQIGLKRLAESTGGWAVFCRTRGEIPGAIQSAFTAIGSHYSVTLLLPENAPKKADLQLTTERPQTLSYRTRLTLKER